MGLAHVLPWPKCFAWSLFRVRKVDDAATADVQRWETPQDTEPLALWVVWETILRQVRAPAQDQLAICMHGVLSLSLHQPHKQALSAS